MTDSPRVTREDVYAAEAARATALCADLAPRELEALVLFGNGLTYEETASAMGVKRNTIRTYAKAIHRKLDVETNAEAVVLAAKARHV